jgi:hypothetical protein
MKRLLFLAFAAMAATMFVGAQEASPLTLTPTRQDVSPDLVSMALANPLTGAPVPSEVVQKHGPVIDEIGSAATATFSSPFSPTAVQSSVAGKPLFSAAPGVNFEALGAGTLDFTVTSAPPDTTLAVGPNHIVQWVNSRLAIYNKFGTLLLPAPGFVNGNLLWAGFGGLCQTTNRGDPLVAYDKMADRWIFSQFAFNVTAGNPSSPYLQCFAVSTGPDPAGPYNRYAYTFASFNDYGKIGVWPDAYYLSYNSFAGSPAGMNDGVIVCAYDRAAMIAGAAATSICAPTAFYALGASFLPSDLEGNTTLPPAGAANYMLRFRTGTSGTGRALRLMRFKVNSFSPPSITFNDGQGGALGSNIDMPINNLPACNGFADACIPQFGTTTLLDTLGDRLMYRLGYRNRGGVESLVVNVSGDPDGAGPQASAVRWFEIRNPSAATPTLFQNATFNPDSTNRWMGSIAMDKNGNMALGYSASSAAINPGIRITGRLRSEVRNQMQAETVIQDGTGSQIGTLTRWGDYSTMRVDPADDCTFWFTTEYIAANGTFNWRTRIASFKFANCN